MSAVARGAAGIVAGIVLAGVGILVGRSTAESAPPATVAPVDTAAPVGDHEPDWVAGGGVRWLSTVIVPGAFDVSEGRATLEYELVGLGTPDGIIPSLLPEHWQLTTTDGRTFQASVDPPVLPTVFGGDDTVRPIGDSVTLDGLPADLSPSDVAILEVIGWRSATPVDVEVEMSSEIGSTVRLFDGVTVELATIIEQESGTILDFDLVAAPDPWRSRERSPFGRSSAFSPVGAGWSSSASTIGGTGLTGGSTGFQLRRTGADVPETIRMRYTRVAWVPVEGKLAVPVGSDDG